MFKYFQGFSGAGDVYLNISPAPEKVFLYIYTYIITLQRRRSVYIHLSGAGKAGEVFIYTA